MKATILFVALMSLAPAFASAAPATQVHVRPPTKSVTLSQHQIRVLTSVRADVRVYMLDVSKELAQLDRAIAQEKAKWNTDHQRVKRLKAKQDELRAAAHAYKMRKLSTATLFFSKAKRASILSVAQKEGWSYPANSFVVSQRPTPPLRW